MKCIIFSNGEYGALESYRPLVATAELVLCADGGANYAYDMQIIPDMIIGDMDSIRPEVREYYEQQGVPLQKFPRRKDFTDTQLVLSIAASLHAGEIVFIGSLGGRLDHTLSNLFAGLDWAWKGKKISHFHPDYTATLVSNGELEIHGQAGDLVSVLALSEQARGVSEKGFEYPLDEVLLESKNPYAVSNVMSEPCSLVSVREGVLLVIYYRRLPG